MLVQHLLTERLIRTIFDNQDFTRRNVIAAEVEKVIDALVSQVVQPARLSQVAGPLLPGHRVGRGHDREFYREAALLEHGLRAVLPGLLGQGGRHARHRLHAAGNRRFHVRQRGGGACRASSARPWATQGVQILDPCTGTGNFIVNLLRRIPKQDLPRMYRQQLFANEVMLLPYYIAALNIEHAYYELTGELRGVSRAVFRGHARFGEREAEHVRVHDRGERGARATRDRGADYGGDRQPALQRLAAQRERQQQEPQVRDHRPAGERDLRQGLDGHEQERAFRHVREVLPLGGGSARTGGTASFASSPTTASSIRSPSTGCGSTCCRILRASTTCTWRAMSGTTRNSRARPTTCSASRSASGSRWP